MAMPGLQSNKKFKRLVRALDAIAYGETKVRGFGMSLAAGSLELMWAGCWATLDDVLGTPEDVEAAASWNGEPGVLFAALRDAGAPEGGPGFVEEVPGKPGIWRVHDLWVHAPEFVKRQITRQMAREENGQTISALRAEAGRKGGLAKAANRAANGKQTADTCQANVATNASPRLASPQEETFVAEPAGSSDPAAPPSLPSSAAGEAETTPPKAQPSASPKPDPAWERVAEVWTTVCVPAGFAKARGTAGQRKAAATRMREAGWFDAFQAACTYAAAEPFYRGAGSSGWTADLGWFLKPGNSEKTAEKAETKRGTNGRRTEDAELLRALAEAERGDDGEPGPDDAEPGAGDGRDGPGVRFSPPFDPPANEVAARPAPVSAALGALLGHRR